MSKKPITIGDLADDKKRAKLVPASPNHAPIKKFAGLKPLLMIQEQCLAAGIDFVDDLWRQGDDCISIWTKAKDKSLGYVIYNTFNGCFFGKTPEGEPYGPQGLCFNSDNSTFEEEPWFQALLSFFYTEKTASPDLIAPDVSRRIDPSLAV